MLSEFTHLFGSIPLLTVAFAIVRVFVSLWLAIAVLKDANARLVNNVGLFLRSPCLWFCVVVATGGYFAALAYWLIHYSTFRYRGAAQS
ncbi:MAG: hypothetical protein QM790_06485 [Nibricoccus sp.]